MDKSIVGYASVPGLTAAQRNKLEAEMRDSALGEIADQAVSDTLTKLGIKPNHAFSPKAADMRNTVALEGGNIEAGALYAALAVLQMWAVHSAQKSRFDRDKVKAADREYLILPADIKFWAEEYAKPRNERDADFGDINKLVTPRMGNLRDKLARYQDVDPKTGKAKTKTGSQAGKSSKTDEEKAIKHLEDIKRLFQNAEEPSYTLKVAFNCAVEALDKINGESGELDDDE